MFLCNRKSAAAMAAVSVLAAAPCWAQSKTVPATGSGYAGGNAAEWDSKWDLFKSLLGKSDSDINTKLNTAYSNYVNGPVGTRIVYSYNSTESYVYAGDDGNGNHLVLTEGQSYGMMIAVQRNDQATFDKLWRFAKNRMQHNRQAPYWYYLAWQVGIDSNNNVNVLDPNSAADGEIWFTAALLNAANRWGNNSTGIDYAGDAQNLLTTMLHAQDWNVGQSNPNNVSNLFTASQNASNSTVPADEQNWSARDQVRFVPTDGFWTDPSYHLPAFFQLFASYAPSADTSRWWDITWKSRVYLLPRACGSDVFGTHPNNSGSLDNGSTGLAPSYSLFDGTATDSFFDSGNSYGSRYTAESWRAIANMGVDYMWWKTSGNTDFDQEPIVSDRLLTFFNGVNDGWLSWADRYSYTDDRSLNGVSTYTEATNAGHRPGVAAMNAVGALTSSRDFATNFVDELWNLAQPNDQNDRYYSGNLYMLALLQASGNFRVWWATDEGSATIYDFESTSSNVATASASPATTGGTTQGWQALWNGISNVTTSTAQKKSGANSLAFTVTGGTGNGFQAVGIYKPKVNAGNTVSAWVWVPSSLKLNAIELQLRNPANQIIGTFSVNNSSLTRNAWNQLSGTIPINAGSINVLAVQFDTDGASTGTAYVDCVTRR